VRAPREARQAEINREIVDELADQDADREALEILVRATVDELRALDRSIADRGASKRHVPTRGRRQENVEDFTAIRKQVDGLQKALKKASGPALAFLFSSESYDDRDFPPVAEHTRMLDRLQQFGTMLAIVRRRCESLLQHRPGEHASADFRQRRVAEAAWHLLRVGGKEPAGGTLDSCYGRIASLLYEAMTAEPDRDLQWACKAALRKAAEGSLRI
jgi:hypothetical protein